MVATCAERFLVALTTVERSGHTYQHGINAYDFMNQACRDNTMLGLV
jgi:hypothetical protein